LRKQTGVVAQLFENLPDVRFAPEDVRMIEALVFASAEPLEEAAIAARLRPGCDVKAALAEVQRQYSSRGVNFIRLAGRWMFRTSPDLSWLLAREDQEKRKMSRAAIETLAIIAYHQPVTRADIEHIRGVSVSKGAVDALLEAGWIRLRGRRKAPGRPVTFGTTSAFLIHFGLDAIGDLPGVEELKEAGMFDGKLPPGFGIPRPDDGDALRPDEDPLDEGALEETWGALREDGEEA
jgi:segregation and condensation protein B